MAETTQNIADTDENPGLQTHLEQRKKQLKTSSQRLFDWLDKKVLRLERIVDSGHVNVTSTFVDKILFGQLVVVFYLLLATCHLLFFSAYALLFTATWTLKLLMVLIVLAPRLLMLVSVRVYNLLSLRRPLSIGTILESRYRENRSNFISSG